MPSADELRIAGSLNGLELEDSEIELMLGDVSRNLAGFEALRSIPLDNVVPNALVFDPLGVGVEMRAKPAGGAGVANRTAQQVDARLLLDPMHDAALGVGTADRAALRIEELLLRDRARALVIGGANHGVETASPGECRPKSLGAPFRAFHASLGEARRPPTTGRRLRIPGTPKAFPSHPRTSPESGVEAGARPGRMRANRP